MSLKIGIENKYEQLSDSSPYVLSQDSNFTWSVKSTDEDLHSSETSKMTFRSNETTFTLPFSGWEYKESRTNTQVWLQNDCLIIEKLEDVDPKTFCNRVELSGEETNRTQYNALIGVYAKGSKLSIKTEYSICLLAMIVLCKLRTLSGLKFDGFRNIFGLTNM